MPKQSNTEVSQRMDTSTSEDIVEIWQKKYETDPLTIHLSLREYWRCKVPELFAPRSNCDCLRIKSDEELVQKTLYEPLEIFMCGGDPAETYQRLKKFHDPPSLCGRVFKPGDPTYGCRDCGMDPTCVLCADCFMKSAHGKHRYKISTSSGGGYCDCGDKEAWKQDTFCTLHLKGELESNNKNPLSMIPHDLHERTRLIFECVLQYAKELLSYNNPLSLRSDLEIKDSDLEPTKMSSLFDTKDTYATMLFNDEVHTYEQVISTLERAIECTHREAVAFVTSIDREGRCIVRCSSFQICMRAKEVMEKHMSRGNGKALKVQVFHSHVIAHQVFAGRLLTWLHDLLNVTPTFRLIFSEIVASDSFSLLETIFRADTQMWKTARIQWHNLFISGMLMDMESKKAFARVFTKYYSAMMRDFILDDHDHSVCIVSLTVQLFTVPTIALMLIAENEVLFKLLNTFLSECNDKLKEGKLALEQRDSNTPAFRRIQYILYDLKYLLGVKPEEWTDPLRKGFLVGFSYILKLLSYMQGMDPVVRQVGQHIEFEPEWESAFNLHIKLASVIPLVIDWCASDRVVLIKAYRLLLTTLGEQLTEDMKRKYVRELLDYSISVIEYDVSSAPVSIHLPLTRLLAGLTLELQKYGLNYNSSEFSVKGKPFPDELMEPVLRTQVVIAQVNAGMWRRNGFYLSNQIYFYHNVRCRQEMLDRDIMLLQIAATLMDANEFLIHLLNKFRLLNWAEDCIFDYQKTVNPSANPKDSTSYSESMLQTVKVAEEFLHLIMTLVSERYTPGIGQVTEEERVKKEIIQLLCIEDMPHSQLNKALPEGSNRETGMEKVIDEVAVFEQSAAKSKGLFKLKPKYYDEYNLFYYHYTREEQSKSEVAQRNRKKKEKQEECCPPPVPPPLTDTFMMLNNILQCDVFLHLVSSVLTRFAKPTSDSISEVMFQIVLHLIGYALHEEERYFDSVELPYFRFTSLAKKFNILGLLENIVGTPRTLTHKSLLSWTINFYQKLLNKRAEKTGAVMRQVPKAQEASSSAVELDKESDKRERARQRRMKIMKKMNNMQMSFIKTNEILFKETSAIEQQAADIAEETPMDLSEPMPLNMIALGKESTRRPIAESLFTCILCHQDNYICDIEGKPEGKAMVLGAFIQRSTVLSKNRSKAMLDTENLDTTTLPADLHWGVHASSCGHAMHASCWQRYFEEVNTRERRRPYRFRKNVVIDIDKCEYLCPLCESLCNTALPLLPSVTKNLSLLSRTPQAKQLHDDLNNMPLSTWLQIMYLTLEKKFYFDDADGTIDSSPSSSSSKSPTSTLYPPKLDEIYAGLSLHGENCVAEFKGLFLSNQAPEFNSACMEMMGKIDRAIYMHGLGLQPKSSGPHNAELIWCMTAYTIKVLEETQRNSDRALLTSISELDIKNYVALVRFAAFSPLPIERKNVQNSVMKNLWNLLECTDGSKNILEWDAFSTLVSLCIGLPEVYADGYGIAGTTIQDFYLLKICFLAHLVQLLITYEVPIEKMAEDTVSAECPDTSMDVDKVETSDDSPMEEAPSGDAEWFKQILVNCRSKIGLPPLEVDAKQLYEYIRKTCLPFLRCCGLFFHFMTEVPIPEELTCSVWLPESEFYCLLRYLGLTPHLSDCLNEPEFTRVIEDWCSHPTLFNYMTEVWSNNKFEWTSINQLIELPQDYSELINNVSQFPCPASPGEDIRAPTMCLICKKMLCSDSYCCQSELNFGTNGQYTVGACTYHAHMCSAGTGIFLRVRECRVLLLTGKIKGCYMAPPYIDKYGETDQCLKRGNPLYLDKKRYEKLHKMWLSHNIPYTISHILENSPNILYTDWQNF